METRRKITTREIFEKYTPNNEVLTEKDIFEIEQNMIGFFSLLDKLDRKYFPKELKPEKETKQ